MTFADGPFFEQLVANGVSSPQLEIDPTVAGHIIYLDSIIVQTDKSGATDEDWQGSVELTLDATSIGSIQVVPPTHYYQPLAGAVVKKPQGFSQQFIYNHVPLGGEVLLIETPLTDGRQLLVTIQGTVAAPPADASVSNYAPTVIGDGSEIGISGTANTVRIIPG